MEAQVEMRRRCIAEKIASRTLRSSPVKIQFPFLIKARNLGDAVSVQERYFLGMIPSLCSRIQPGYADQTKGKA